MNLFEISGTISLDGSGALSALSNVTSAAKGAAGVLASLGGAALKVGGAVAGGVATAGGAIVKQAVSSYAAAEQLVGGIETLFGDSAGQVQQYAAEAFKTAGLSSNEYMETAMGFSASLKQSLNGDTAAMAEYANMAIIDMSDNANKMGTDMGMIQNAYQGFAKQNYTMLDNLKLGYGGTKTEMQRLIKDANAVKEANGEMADLSIDSLADVVEAIHIVQTEMGITGTTAKEASDTISGSAASMKAAWSNLMTGVADENADMGQLVDNFVESGKTAAENFVPRVGAAISGTMQLGQILVPELISEFEAYQPQLQEGFYSIVTEALNFSGFEVNQSDVQGTFESIFGGIGKVSGTVGTELGDLKTIFSDNIGNIAQVLSENGVTIDGFFSGLSETLSTVSEPIKAGVDTALKGFTKLTDWATEDGTTLNGILSGMGEGFKGAAGGLTDFIEATGYLFEGNTEKAGEEAASGFDKAGKGFIRGALDAGIPVANAYGRFGQWLGETLFGEDFVFPWEEMTPEKALSLFGGTEEMYEQLYPEDVTSPTITPTVDQSWALELEEQGDQSQAGLVYTYSTPITQEVQVETTGTETAAADIASVTTATEAADGATVTTEVTASGAETATAQIEGTASAAAAADGKTVSVKVDASSASQATAQIQQSAQAMQSAMEFSLAVPPVNTSSLSAAVTAASDAAAQIQAAFDGLSLSIPTVGGGGGVSATSAGGGAVATAAGAEYYASGGIMMRPTEFGFNPYSGNRMIGGEAGPEAIAPITTLQNYVGEAVAEQNAEQTAMFDRMLGLMETLVESLPSSMREAMEGMAFKTDRREFGRLVKGAKA